MPTTPSAARLVETEPPGYPWELAVAQHSRRVVVALLAHGAPLHEAEELAQETWVRLIGQRAQGQLQRIELPGLAIRQALFLLSDARKKRARHPTEPLDEAHGTLDGDLEGALVGKQQLDRAEKALAEVGPRAREVFDFVYHHPELKHEQAATRLGLSTQRLRQTLCEVRQRLRDAMKESS